MAYLSLGYYAQAMRVLTDARRDLLEAGSAWLAALAGLSLVECLVSTGRFRDAIETVTGLHGELARFDDSVSGSQALVWQARASAGLHDYDAALRTLDRAAGLLSASDDLAIHRAVLEAERAELLLELGNVAESLSLIQQVIPMLGRAGLTIEAAAAHALRGSALLQMGQLTEANTAAGEVLAVAEDEGLRWLTARALHLRGRVQIGQGDEVGARRSFASAVRHIDRVHRRVAWDDRATFSNTSVPLYTDALALALRQQRLPVALRYAERCKASGLADHLRGRVDIRPRARDARSRHLIDELARLRERYAWLGAAQWKETASGTSVHGAMGPIQRGENQAEVKRIERRLAEIWRELQVSNPAYRGEAAALDLVDAADDESGDEDDVAQRWVERVCAALGPNEDVALLEYAGLGDDLALFVLRGHEVRTIRLENAGRAIRDLVPLLQLDVDYSARAAESGGRSLLTMAAKTRGVLRRLQQVLLEPATPLLDGVGRLVIVPHGAAHHVPFHALYNGQAFLIEDCEVAYAPCASLLEHFEARQQALQEVRPRHSHQALVATCSNGGALAQVEVEGQAVLEAFGGRLLHEDEATLGALRAFAGDYTVLHLAAHAVFRPDEPLFSSLQLYDGRLSTLEVFDLELSCSLATLSACETALGTAGAGDELMGLSRALLYAGAPSLVLSLWKVEDRSTAALMTSFYRALCQGVSKAGALRAAQLDLIHHQVEGDYSAPFYWAPFQLIGHAGPV